VRRQGLENYVKGGLGLSGRSSSSGGRATGSGDSYRRGGGYTPRLFQLLHQVGGFHHRQFAQYVYNVCYVSHVSFQSVSSSSAAPDVLSSRPVNRRFTMLFSLLPRLLARAGGKLLNQPLSTLAFSTRANCAAGVWIICANRVAGVVSNPTIF